MFSAHADPAQLGDLLARLGSALDVDDEIQQLRFMELLEGLCSSMEYDGERRRYAISEGITVVWSRTEKKWSLTVSPVTPPQA